MLLFWFSWIFLRGFTQFPCASRLLSPFLSLTGYCCSRGSLFYYYSNAAKHLAKLIPFIGNLQHIKCLLSRVVCISSCHPGESGLRWKKCRNIKRHALHAKEKQSVQILWISPTSRVSLSFLHVGSVLEPLASSMKSEKNQSARRGVRLTIVPKVVSTMAGMAMTPH